MKIFVPDNFLQEKKYIIRQLLSYLSLPEYTILPSNDQWYTIENKERKILIKDKFFASIKDGNYIQTKYLPQTVQFLPENKFLPENNLVFLFGDPIFEITSDQIEIGADIFASAFYFLTLWYEKVITEKDEHDRSPDRVNILVRNNLHYRPVVCEYVAFLSKLLKFIGVRAELKNQYTLRITHDVDMLQRFTSPIDFAKGAVNDILRRHSIRYFYKTTKAYLGYGLGRRRDPYDTFDFLMDTSERAGLVSEFNFIPSKLDEPYAFYDYRDVLAAQKIQHIRERGHIIGLHGSYRAYRDKQLFLEELQRFKQTWHIEPKVGRQHFLRFAVPYTWQIWEEAGLEDDSTIGFNKHAGFRVGICYPYKVFDIEQRKTLTLTESPLLLMEGALLNEIGHDFHKFWDKAMELHRQVKRYNGNFYD